MRKTVILETHNIKNPNTGFGVFNYGLVNGLNHLEHGNLDLILSVSYTHLTLPTKA